jgi:pyrroloquinoline quinone (PQQ) biosynthesis protein C
LNYRNEVMNSVASADMACESTAPLERRGNDRRSGIGFDRRLASRPPSLRHPDRRITGSKDRRIVNRRSGSEIDLAFGLASTMPLDVQLEKLLEHADLEGLLATDPALRPAFANRLASLLIASSSPVDDGSLRELHRSLFHFYAEEFKAPPCGGGKSRHALLIQAQQKLETLWEERLESLVARDVDLALAAGDSFEQTLSNFCGQHRLAVHPFFTFVEHEASKEQLVSFFLSDSAVVLRFFDLLVLTLVGADDEIRGELVDNLWDEMGHRDPLARHNRLFLRLLRYVGLDEKRIAAACRDFHLNVDWPCLAGHNLYLLLGTQRRNYLRSLGCLGSAELMDAAQYAKIVRGCHRLGWSDPEGLAYYTSHAEADLEHGLGWLDRVLLPLVNKYPHAAREFLIGTAFRLETAAQYYDSLLNAMGKGVVDSTAVRVPHPGGLTANGVDEIAH